MSEQAPTAAKSPDSSPIGGLVAGIFSLFLLTFIFYILWRTRNNPQLLPSEPEKIIPLPSRESSRISSRTQSGLALSGLTPGSAVASADNIMNRSGANSVLQIGTSHNSLVRIQQPENLV